jgi:hypothetical protein
MTTDKGIVGYRKGSWQDILELIKTLFTADKSFGIIEKTEDIRFDTKEKLLSSGTLAQPWTSGRIFCENFELRWNWEEGDFLIMCLTEKRLPTGFEQIGEYETMNTELLLWGNRKGADEPWIEIRIPRPLEYPLDGDDIGIAKIVGDHYLKDGIIQFTRFRGVKRYETI